MPHTNLKLRRAAERGHFDFGWLDTWHSFSFGEYFDPSHMGFRSLRVMNEDRIKPGAGFGMHGHRDMEIVTIVLSGALEHRDSLGHGEVLRPGELQRMTAGSGIQHSEFNPSNTEPVHLYQIWLRPAQRGSPPGYEQRRFDSESRADRWQLVASPDGRDGSLTIGQDARLWWTQTNRGTRLPLEVAAGRGAWLQVMTGAARLGNVELSTGDGVAVDEAATMEVAATDDAQLVWFDLA